MVQRGTLDHIEKHTVVHQFKCLEEIYRKSNSTRRWLQLIEATGHCLDYEKELRIAGTTVTETMLMVGRER